MRFRSVLGAFIFILAASFVALLIFIQTKTFGRVATRVITDLSERRVAAKVSIKSIGLSVFPPGLELNQVKVQKDFGPEKKINVELGKLGVYLGLVELEEKNLALGEIRIADSLIQYTAPESNEPPIERIDPEIIDQVFEIPKKLPVRIDTVVLTNARLLINHELLEAKRFKIFKKKDTFLTRFHVTNIQPTENQNLTIDEVWGDAEIGKGNINVHRLKIQHDVHSLLIKGKIKNYLLLKDSEANLTGESSIHLSNIKKLIKLPELIRLDQGNTHLSFNIGMKNRAFSGNADLSLNNIKSSLINAEQVIATIKFEKNAFKLNNLTLTSNEESARILSAVEVYNMETKKILKDPIRVQVSNLRLNNALSVLPSLKSLKGELTGIIDFKYDSGNMDFIPQNGFVIKNLGLVVGEEKPFTVLMIKKAKLTNSSFRLINKAFRMNTVAELNNSLIDVNGYIDSKSIDFIAKDAIIDLEDFGNIANLDIKGKGTLNLKVFGSLEDTSINLAGKTKGFEVLGYRLGQAEKDITIALKDSSVIIHKLEAIHRNTPISGTGAINYGNLDIALGINSSKASFHDLKEILHPIFSKITFLPSDMDLNAKIDANIFGKTKLDELRIKTEVQFKDLLAYGESFSYGDFQIDLNKQNLKIKDLNAYKGKGFLRGDFSFNLESKKMDLNYIWEDFFISNFNLVKKLKLNLDGNLSGSLTGDGTPEDFLLKLIGKITETKSQNNQFQDSKFDLDISPSFIKGNVGLLGTIIQSDFDMALKNTRSSKISLSLNATEIKPFATAVLGQHLESEQFSGSTKLNLDASFKSGFENLNMQSTLETLVFRHDSFNVNYKSGQPQFIIQDGQVKKWDLNIQESDFSVQSSGSGTFGKKVLLNQNISFNSKIFEILFAQVLSTEGFLRNSFKIEGLNDHYNISLNSQTSDLNLTLDSVPFPLNHLSYDVDFSEKRLLIQEMKTSLENGSISLKGDVFFDDENPDVNIKYALDKAEIPILGKSILNLSGEGIILGNAPPYNVGGEIIVNKAQIINELNEFNSKSNALSQVRFLPPNQESALGKFINLNLTVKTDNPIRISNSMMDVSLKGEVMLLGSPSRPRGEGSLHAPLNTSRIFFKNNEYTITNADLSFNPKKEMSNPDFDVQALTYISSYKVSAKASGDLERFNFDLTSEPSLTRNSILSLIAFGYTDEIQSSLTQEQQQNLTQVGVGSFVFDRFKISDILNKQFGLQVNLGTVFEQSSDSLLSGRSQDGQGTIGRTRTATKIELKKRLDEASNLSVSSTMGGSIGQRQSMNLNYSISKKVQLEGVYELKTNAEGEEDIIDNSIGGDLKFRWTFK